MTHQEAGKWTTPYGPNVRYTVRLHVVGEGRNASGSVRAVDRYVEYRVITPLGELNAVARAAVNLRELEPDSIYSEVDISNVEHDFTIEPDDYRDPESYAR
jgi:hypothetical protein